MVTLDSQALQSKQTNRNQQPIRTRKDVPIVNDPSRMPGKTPIIVNKDIQNNTDWLKSYNYPAEEHDNSHVSC